ncbi:protein kinase domain-containing protein [Psychromonas ossibalaenae]|uniref:protein kinase domain-containing protein n=1 Tax=Psychromonas ossibalaenae TaxID=444922 RepID=UPI000376CC54|nr:protein kinase [Psychromonas ossibalaenae]
MTDIEDYNAGDILVQRFTLISAFTPQVWLASDRSCGTKVIIKHAENELLHREWSCMSQCSSPYIQQSLEYLPASSLLILSYINGQSILAFSQVQSSLFISLIPQIVRAVCHLHQQGWVHGDIKPSNVIYQPELGSIKIIDFGASWPAGTALEHLPQWQLTPGFSRKNKHQGTGLIEVKDDWFALQQWLRQIDPQLLTQGDKNKLTRWKKWLVKQLD